MVSKEWDRRSVGGYIFAQYEKEMDKHALRAESFGLRNCSSRCLGLIFGLSFKVRSTPGILGDSPMQS